MRRLAVVGLLVATAGLVSAPNFSPASLTGSSFEIDTDANLIVDATPGTADWASLAHTLASDPEKRAIDIPSGSLDNSYKGGVKEDTNCPAEETGSIPNNKSDLLSFHVYAEPGSGSHPGFLNLAWSRITEPAGATLMDFEFNQGSLDVPADRCASGPNVQRRAGDLLIEYGLASNDTNATITKRTWSGSAWGPATSLSANNAACGVNVPCAEGTVNTSAITGPNSDGIGARSARTFGEASLDLRAIFGSGQCAAFGTATLKSRSSESFTSQVKDFIAPIKVNIDNCGSITIDKVTENGDDSFAFVTSGTGLSNFSLGNATAPRVFSALGAGNYTVDEDITGTQATAGWTLKSLVCTPTGTGTSATVGANGLVSITLANGGDVTCTYTNHKKLSPSITTLLNGTSANLGVSVGDSVYDTASLSGASSDAGGTVTYTVYSDSACTLGARDAGTKAVTNGVVTQSESLAFTTAGTFYWQAVYSGDTNNFGVTSGCDEEVLSVAKKAPGASTAQSLIPNDSFALTGGLEATGDVTFSLYGPNDADCSEKAAYSETVALTNDAAVTTNTDFAVGEGTWKWEVVYAGDGNNEGVTLTCGVEAFTVDDDTTNN